MNNAKLFSDEAANIYERAIGTLLKKNMLLYFAFADYEEVSSVNGQRSYREAPLVRLVKDASATTFPHHHFRPPPLQIASLK